MFVKPLFLLFGIALTIAACDNKYHFEAKKDISNASWMYRDTCDFTFHIGDTTTLYNIHLDLTANKSFADQNLYLRLHTTFPDGRCESVIRTFDIYDPAGNLNGAASGEQAKQHLMLQENAFFNKSGDYTVTIEQFMRRDSLPGIVSVGLAVNQLDGKRK